MKNTKYTLALFCCLAVIIISVPVSMIAKRETVLRKGEVLKFLTAPVDPYDAFRGRYVSLNIAENNAPVPGNTDIRPGQNVCAIFKKDARGFAKIAGIIPKYSGNLPYIRAKVHYINKHVAFLNMPIDRYYMEEGKAPAAESTFRRYNTADRKEAYITVRVKGGLAVVERLYVGGKTIEDAIRNPQESQETIPPAAWTTGQSQPQAPAPQPAASSTPEEGR